MLDLFNQKNFQTRLFPRFKGLSGTAIRQRIVNREPWASEVPQEIFKFIQKIHGEERIRKIHDKGD